MINDKLEIINDTNYYQMRYPVDTTKDYYYLMREANGYNVIIIRYGNPSSSGDANLLKNNYREMAKEVANAIKEYIGVSDKNEYTVVSGDSLYSIAKKYNTSVDEIKKANGMSNNLIVIGEKLTIPKSNTYIVSKGDNLYSIAKRFKTTVKKIMEINNLSSDKLNINQKLTIP